MDSIKPSQLSFALAAVAIVVFFRVFAANRNRQVEAQKDLTNAKPSYIPVAIFVGGTAGIGRGMVEAFAHISSGNAHIVIIGRNEDSAKAIISKFPKPTAPGAKHEFIRCDATLMSNIEETTKALVSRMPKVNYLVLSSMDVRTLSREATEEGIDSKMALGYYGRVKFTRDLTPALENARKNGEDAKVFIVGAPGQGKYIHWNDLGLKKTTSFFFEFRAQLPLYLDLFLQELEARHPSLTLIHAAPGMVRTSLGNGAVWPIPYIFKLMFFFGYPWSLSYSESGLYMLRAMLLTTKSPGVWNVGKYGDVLSKGSTPVALEEDRRRIWEHTVAETTIKQ